MQAQLSYREPVRARYARVPPPPPIDVTDLSGSRKAQQRHIYKVLLANWWPHPAHGQIVVGFSPDVMIFRCACGEQLHVCHEAAQQLGFL